MLWDLQILKVLAEVISLPLNFAQNGGTLTDSADGNTVAKTTKM